ncbi:MAG: hypothetical protein HY711_04610 [Candidatus Melainabacteria bacterium]|nr:hypothetical protein [Candidatus Melainabacteria bacterium]
MPQFEQVFEDGFTFVFKVEDDAPDLLHIYARHLTTIDDALDVFFDTTPAWNERFNRFENFSCTHGLYWFWINEAEKVVMIISCFRI